MTTSDWIAIAQAFLLAGAAWLAWRGYQLAHTEHKEAREEARKAPLRELVADVIREVKMLAAQAQERVPGAGILRHNLIVGQQQRLAVALTFVPPDVFNLFATRELTTCDPNLVTEEAIGKSRAELLRLFAEIEAGRYAISQVALPGQSRDLAVGRKT